MTCRLWGHQASGRDAIGDADGFLELNLTGRGEDAGRDHQRAGT